MASIKDQDLSAFLGREDFSWPAIFVFGSDSDFVDSAVSETIDRIRKNRPELGAVERAGADSLSAAPAAVLDFFHERPLFGDHRFMVAHNITERHAASLSALFSSDAPEPGPLLLFSSSSLTSKSKLLSAARNSGFCLMVRAYDAAFSRQDLSRRLAEFGVHTIEPAAVDLLHRRLAGENLATRSQALELIALYADDGRLSLAEAESCLPPNEDELAGELLGALLSSDLKALIAWRRRGAAEGLEPIAQLAILTRALGEARRARLAAIRQSEGGRVFWKTEKIVKDAASRLHDIDRRLEKAISAAHRLERAARSSEGLIPEKTERLIINLARYFH